MAEKSKPNIVFIMETKLNNKKCDRIRRRLRCDGCFGVEAVGKGGGLALLWNDEVQLEIVNYSQRHINAWIGGKEESQWLLTCFYGPPETVKRKEAWSLLKSMKPNGNEGWCIVGDFNEIITNDEKWGGKARPENQMEMFRELMRDGNLFDLGWRGDMYTWSNSHTYATFTKERLDRVVANPQWMNFYSETWVEVLVARTSDHKPLLVHINVQNPSTRMQVRQRKKGFKYEACWALDEECEVVLKEAWTGFSKVIGLLNNSRKALLRWNKNIKQRQGQEVEEKTKILQNLQAMENGSNVEEIRKVTKELHLALEKEDLW
ncbi:hypothetical protein F2P56_002218 [Juglans regia]|uniref:Endonuclease/exonuclease/phosphatase domain-containing protein n=2 Tax=Juglans regia TaxID=51240 RepID=A0A834D993_JUGRE|nr:uncharacterized protein LOC108993568 [Juglans regia]KAF5481578.1 hypothetical protein F2P56_002218 [Juglans regia]